MAVLTAGKTNLPSELLLAIATCWLWHTTPLALLLVLSWQPPETAKLEPESAGTVGAYTLLRLHHANWLTVGRLGTLQGQCIDCCGDQLAGSSGDWKLPLRTSHIGKERVPKEQAFIEKINNAL